MRLSRKSALLALAAALGATQAVAQKPAAKKEKAAENKEEALDLPIPKGQPQKGVKVPLYGANGKLKMNFEIGIGTYIDEENIKLEKLRVETYRDDGSRELDMDLPDAVYNKRTKTISSQTKVLIKREDFEVTGNTMAFNIETREGTLGGGVKMLVYNFGETTKPTESKPIIEFQPTTPATSPKKPTDKKNPK
jgi:lipopolysaccharide assembly outer membrane protein LptD (OstA)